MGTASPFDAKVAVYARFGNGPVAARVQAALPPGGRVLDVGCASGGLLALLGEAGYRAGIEPAAGAAASARAHADLVHHGGIDDELPWEDGSFDVVVLADVVEHVLDPDAALARAVALTRPGGRVVLSVPNVAFWRARLTLLRGRFPREDSGIFDATHLQWFTLDRLRDLTAGAGLSDVRIDPIVPALRNWAGAVERMPAGRAAQLEAVWQRLGRARPGLSGFQLLATGVRPAG